MTTLICAGGSGTRVLEAVLHLCAAGLGPDVLRIFVIDPDGTNGNVTQTKTLVERYRACQEAFGEDLPLFRTKLDLMNGPQGLRVWNPVNGRQQFGALLNYQGLSEQQKDVAHLFFTQDELEMEMNVGFRGHPALGAAALSLMPLYKNDPLWSQLPQAINQEVIQGRTEVVIVGSVFGGTGASAIHPLVRYLRSLPQTNADNLKVAAVALVPYFRFSGDATAQNEEAKAQQAAQSEWFSLASRSAAEYYEHLREHKDWELDAMYWLGDDSPMQVKYSIGGPAQHNPSHFVDLLAGFAFLDFLKSPPQPGTCCYAGPQESSNDPGQNVLTWGDVPAPSDIVRENWYKALHRFHLVGAAHLGFYWPLLKDERLRTLPYCVPWYMDRFTNGSKLSTKDNQDRLEALSLYFRENYFPWWGQMHAAERDRVRLFNRRAWFTKDETLKIELNRLGNLIYPDTELHSLDPVDALFERTIQAGKSVQEGKFPSSTYLAILAQAAQSMVEQAARGEASH
jgi:hypothetical protein